MSKVLTFTTPESLSATAPEARLSEIKLTILEGVAILDVTYFRGEDVSGTFLALEPIKTALDVDQASLGTEIAALATAILLQLQTDGLLAAGTVA